MTSAGQTISRSRMNLILSLVFGDWMTSAGRTISRSLKWSQFLLASGGRRGHIEIGRARTVVVSRVRARTIVVSRVACVDRDPIDSEDEKVAEVEADLWQRERFLNPLNLCPEVVFDCHRVKVHQGHGEEEACRQATEE